MDNSSAADSSLKQPPRYEVDLNAVFRAVGSLDWADASLVNLSHGGLCMRSSAQLTRDQVIEFVIETIDGGLQRHRRRIVARVVWRREGRYGVQFLQSTRRKAIRRVS